MTFDLESCEWRAGADRYTGTVAAAIAAYGLPVDTQSALIRAFERREFSDSIVIDRDSIRGRSHDYDPGIRSMHFGSRGRVCGTVTRAGWSTDHVETALVACAGSECIAWPAVCGNVFRLSRRLRGEPEPVRQETSGNPILAERMDGDDVRLRVLKSAPIADPQAPEVETLGAGPSAGAPEWSASPSGWTGGAYAPSFRFAGPIAPIAPVDVPVAPVPEPQTWALFGLGLVGIGAIRSAHLSGHLARPMPRSGHTSGSVVTKRADRMETTT